MKRLKFRIHPLFWILGVMLIFLGEGFLFLVYILTAVIHEYAHSVTAAFYKCRTEEIVLYPFGAVLYGEFGNLKPSEETVVALSGPLFNLFVSVVITALWWIVPEIYSFTESVVSVNVSIALFNLLPVYPLDGGRILMSFLKIRTGEARAFKTVKILGIFCCFIFCGLYFYSLFHQINYTFAVIAVFLFCSVTDKTVCADAGGVIYPPREAFLQRGVEKKFLQVSGELNLLQLLKLLNTEYYYVIEVKDKSGNTVKTIEHKELEKLLTSNKSSEKLNNI